MKLETELKKLKASFGTPIFKTDYADIVAKFNTKEDKETITAFIKKLGSESLKKTDVLIAETSLKLQMMEISEIVSLAYIAKRYFKKTPQWLYSRVNGNKLNGKQAALSDKDIAALNLALKDIGEKISSTSISL